MSAQSRAARARIAVCAFFFVNGCVVGSWVPHIPDRAHALGLDPARLGAVLLAGGGGALLGMPLAGVLVPRLGSRAVATTAAVSFSLALTLATVAPSIPLLALALLVFGISGGTMDVAMNAQGVLVEERLGRRTISTFHGVYSAGGVAGSSITGAALARGVHPSIISLMITLLLAALTAAMSVWMFPRSAEQPHPAMEKPRFGWPRLQRLHARLLLLGVLAFAAMLSEGAIADWSALFLRVQHGLGRGVAGFGFSAFSAAMVLGRFTGDRTVAALSEMRTLRAGGLCAAAGLAVVLWTHGLVPALAGFALVGIGLANASPILYRSAGKVPGVAPGAGIATAVGIGYAGLLIGPPMLGLVGHAAGLGSIFLVLLLLCTLLALAAPLVRPQQDRTLA